MGQVCRDGLCLATMTLCQPGTADCRADALGCETPTDRDPSNCGGCGRTCAFPNAAASCASGMCRLGSCASGFDNCDGSAGNGCEVRVATDLAHCGACNRACVTPHAQPACAAGACAIAACDAGYADCDGVASNGCEVDLTTSATHCGACAAACAPANAEGACVAVIEVAVDATLPAEGYRLEAGLGRCGQRVAAPDVLGAQYGVSHALENLGFRFRHPYDPLVPDEPALIAGAQLGQVHSPDIPTRGFQLHTIHPTEAYFATWEPGQDNLDNARRIVDWLIKNRGDYLQWVGLDDIMDPAQHAAWKTHSQALIEAAHTRGVRVGLNIQLFGQSNLQRGFDLSDDDTGTVPLADELAARVPLVTDGLSWDVLDVSFGEFFDAEPMRFVEAVNQTAAALRAGAPQAEIHAVVHVGADTRVSYMGQDLIYYFLVKFADMRIVPWIHTVMSVSYTHLTLPTKRIV